MKKLISILMLFFFMFGCAGYRITDDANNQAVAYAAGKGIAVAVNKYAPKADHPLSDAWVNLMAANAGRDPVPAAAIVAFYQEAVMLLTAQSKDPYGLISDLTFLLSLYGGQIVDGKLILAQDIPLRVMKAFELGYKSGRSLFKSYGGSV
jgi:hypothetical protein